MLLNSFLFLSFISFALALSLSLFYCWIRNCWRKKKIEKDVVDAVALSFLLPFICLFPVRSPSLSLCSNKQFVFLLFVLLILLLLFTVEIKLSGMENKWEKGHWNELDFGLIWFSTFNVKSRLSSHNVHKYWNRTAAAAQKLQPVHLGLSQIWSFFHQTNTVSFFYKCYRWPLPQTRKIPLPNLLFGRNMCRNCNYDVIENLEMRLNLNLLFMKKKKKKQQWTFRMQPKNNRGVVLTQKLLL